MSEKVSGYILFFVGIGIMLWSLFSVYRVFTGVAPPINLFKLPAITIDTELLAQAGLIRPTAQLPPTYEMLPASVVNHTSNLFAHLFLMGFVANIGFKSALLGIQLLRPIEVKLRAVTHDQTPA